jgi:hypothetical protein
MNPHGLPIEWPTGRDANLPPIWRRTLASTRQVAEVAVDVCFQANRKIDVKDAGGRQTASSHAILRYSPLPFLKGLYFIRYLAADLTCQTADGECQFGRKRNADTKTIHTIAKIAAATLLPSVPLLPLDCSNSI